MSERNTQNAKRFLELGMMYYDGRGREQSYETAMKYLEKSAHLYNAHAMYLIACMYHEGKGCEPSQENYVFWLEKAANSGNGAATYQLGLLYRDGTYLEKSTKHALNYFLKASELNETKSYCQIAEIYAHEPDFKNIDESRKWYKKGIKLKDSDCYLSMAWECVCGIFAIDLEKAADLIKKDLVLKTDAKTIADATEHLNNYNKTNDSEELIEAIRILDPGYRSRLNPNSETDTEYTSESKENLKTASEEELHFDSSNVQNSIKKYFSNNPEDIVLEPETLIKNIIKITSAPHAIASLELGKYFYDSENPIHSYEKASLFFIESSKLENADAMFMLAQMYSQGIFFQKSLETAFRYACDASKLGNPEAMLFTGKCYMNGEGVSVSTETGYDYLFDSASSGYVRAYSELGDCYLNGTGTSASIEDAHYWYKLGAMDEDPECLQRMGFLHEMNMIPDSDLATALEFYEKSSQSGNEKAYRNLGSLYLDKTKPFYSIDKAVFSYRSGAEIGDSFCQLKIGQFYLNGTFLNKSIPDATEWLTKAASKGNELASALLGQVFLTEGKNKEAEKWFSKITNSGDPDCLYVAGASYYEFNSSPEDLQKCMAYMSRAAEIGNKKAYFYLGECHRILDMGQISADTYNFYKMSAESEDIRSYGQLSYILYTGNGVATDYTAAYKWAKKAADIEDSLGCAVYALCLYYGRGTDKDTDAAMNLLYMGLDSQIPELKTLLYEYQFSNSSKPDLIEVNAWFNDFLSNVNDNEDLLKKLMHPHCSEAKESNFYNDIEQPKNRMSIEEKVVCIIDLSQNILFMSSLVLLLITCVLDIQGIKTDMYNATNMIFLLLSALLPYLHLYGLNRAYNKNKLMLLSTLLFVINFPSFGIVIEMYSETLNLSILTLINIAIFAITMLALVRMDAHRSTDQMNE